MSEGIALPRYKCHKIVHALKIEAMQLHPEGGGALMFEHPFAALELPQEFFTKHNPQPGGYYVVYEDGYKSFSPAKAFEEGYTLMPRTGAVVQELVPVLAGLTGCKLYRVQYDLDDDYLEATSFREAIEIWQRNMIIENAVEAGQDPKHAWDPATEPDSVQMIHDEPLLR